MKYVAVWETRSLLCNTLFRTFQPHLAKTSTCYTYYINNCGQRWCRYGIFRTLMMTAMLCITASMSAVLFNDKCSVAFGSSPLAWGYLMWWIVDTASRITLWPLRDRERLWKMVIAYKNLSNMILLISALLLFSAYSPVRFKGNALFPAHAVSGNSMKDAYIK